MPVIHKIFSETSAAIFNVASSRRDSTFRLHYFPLHGSAHAARLILATTGAKFESTFPKDWLAEKSTVPFGVLPVLYETISSPGEEDQVLEIPESDAIEHYLSRKFNLLGETPFEETRIHALVSSANAVTSFVFVRIASTKDATHKQEWVDQFVSKTAPAWVQPLEEYSKANGTAGYLVGGKLSLADIKAAIAIEVIQGLTGDAIVSAEKTPGLWIIWKTITAIPSYVVWRESAAYQRFDAGYQVFLQGLLAEKED
ncbi:hypothetical protein BGZ70_003173 [Mortierella alpina]|uniref:GST N-terminal domain-containing protein n=1 Tax=Mortierella alpina TaxID=64518 RepID=A0A9P6ITE8_MORAP|nr:hypothetical protein BGZ70_003173 [Mortierella alpina]